MPSPTGAPSDRRDSRGHEEVRGHVRALRAPRRLTKDRTRGRTGGGHRAAPSPCSLLDDVVAVGRSGEDSILRTLRGLRELARLTEVVDGVGVIDAVVER